MCGWCVVRRKGKWQQNKGPARSREAHAPTVNEERRRPGAHHKPHIKMHTASENNPRLSFFALLRREHVLWRGGKEAIVATLPSLLSSLSTHTAG